jgi:hypothetical protein
VNCEGLEGVCYGLIRNCPQHFAGGTEKTIKNFRIAGIRAEIQTQDVLKMKQ